MKLNHISAVALVVAASQIADALPNPIANYIPTLNDLNPLSTHLGEQISHVLQNLPIVNQSQADLFANALKSGKPLLTEEEFRSMIVAQGGTYQDVVKVIYELQGKSYPNLLREPNVTLKAELADFRKVASQTLFANRTLVQQTQLERETLPLFSTFFGPSIINQEVIWPGFINHLLGDGVAIPDWLPNLPPESGRIAVQGGWIGAPGNTPINPAVDPFYNPPASAFAGKAHGTPIAFRQIGSPVPYVNVDRAFQFSFASKDALNADTFGTSAAMIPKFADKRVAFHFLQYVDALSPFCTPSYTLTTNVFDTVIDYIVGSGRIINIPDHGGPQRLFGVGQTEGRITLDAMLALEAYKGAFGIEFSDHYLHGYSGGTVPVGWALQLASEYAPSINIKGAVFGGVVSDITAVGKELDGSLNSGFLPAVLKSYMLQYPDFNDLIVQDLKSPNYINRINAVLDYCIVKVLTNTIGVSFVNTFFKSEQALWTLPLVQKYFQANTMGAQAPPKVPIMIYNGIQDEISPIETVDALVDAWCKQGALIDYYRIANLDHYETFFALDADKYKFLDLLIDGNYKPSSCASWQDATRQSDSIPNFTAMSTEELKKYAYGNFTEEVV